MPVFTFEIHRILPLEKLNWVKSNKEVKLFSVSEKKAAYCWISPSVTFYCFIGAVKWLGRVPWGRPRGFSTPAAGVLFPACRRCGGGADAVRRLVPQLELQTQRTPELPHFEKTVKKTNVNIRFHSKWNPELEASRHKGGRCHLKKLHCAPPR